MVDHGRTLAPGHLRVIDVVRFGLPEGPNRGSWSCTRCGIEHPAAESWSVVFDSARGPCSMVLCRLCVEDYRSPDLA